MSRHRAPIDGHTGWTCDGAAAHIAEATSPGQGSLPAVHAVIYTCAGHRADAEAVIATAGYNPATRPAPAAHRWDPWPCGHTTAHTPHAAKALSDAAAHPHASTQPGADRMPRPRTPDRRNPDGSTTIKIKRACNGCGSYLGDATLDELDRAIEGLELPDVTGECPACAPPIVTVDLDAVRADLAATTEKPGVRYTQEQVDACQAAIGRILDKHTAALVAEVAQLRADDATARALDDKADAEQAELGQTLRQLYAENQRLNRLLYDLTRTVTAAYNRMNVDTRDWAANRGDAWLYGAIVGWADEALADVAARHRWTPQTVEYLRERHAAVRAVIPAREDTPDSEDGEPA